MSLQAISIPPATGQAPEGLIVVLHGWGANAQDVASLLPLLSLSNCQFLCPDGPLPHPYNPPSGRMWYSFGQTPTFPVADGTGLEESRQLLTDWLQSLEGQTGVPLSRTVLAGFSQGGAMTLDVGLNLSLAGLVSLSGYWHQSSQPKSDAFPPVFMAHGLQDNVVPLSAARDARDRLLALGVSVQYQEFQMGHDVRPEVLQLMRTFVLQVLSQNRAKTSYKV
ncbi:MULTISPECIES: alpha/beta hydrolase [Trichocoleus]|uniref:Alpha/beta hydrolase n=1 Tax=Trichocoleus desertorum GB2-A4 TaxID=2933944 RepID=A0ABV0J289_9CYAN|nr:alpha/beta hydrolase [Trichocoleus sp. FACHB-46]MBD1860500.1 alpha/beta hydrolase [Trichocoleus sp. FACHB-46]